MRGALPEPRPERLRGSERQRQSVRLGGPKRQPVRLAGGVRDGLPERGRPGHQPQRQPKSKLELRTGHAPLRVPR